MVQNHTKLSVDFADLWPRYYFDLGRAKLEIAEWLIAQHQEVVEDWHDNLAERDWRHALLDGIGE